MSQEQPTEPSFRDEYEKIIGEFAYGDMTEDDVIKIIVDKNDSKFKESFIEEIEFDLGIGSEAKTNLQNEGVSLLSGESGEIDKIMRETLNKGQERLIKLKDRLIKTMI
jgi:hypothetical protein